MAKIITITLNPAYDIHYEVPQFTLGRENYSTNRTIDAGGKGINISRALQASGISSLALVAMGDENCRDFQTILKQDQLEYVTVPCAGSIRYNITIHPSAGPETRISQDSFNLRPEKLDEMGAQLAEWIEPGFLVAFAGRVPQGIDLPTSKEFLLAIKKAGALLILDTNTFSLQELTEISPWLIKPNEQEIESLLGRSVSGCAEARQAGLEIQKLGMENVLISLGERGMVYAGEGISYEVKVPQITPLSTIGAGDSTLAGYMYGHVQGMSQLDTLKNAAAFGTAACLAKGTQPPSPEDISRIRDEISVFA